MPITNVDQLVNALGNNSSRIVIDKGSVANQTIGRMCSLWRATGFPAQGAIPAAPTIPTSATLGSMGFTNQTAPSASYLGWLSLVSGNNAQSVQLYDRLAHNGGLSFNVNTLQTITGFDLGAAGLNVPLARVGEADYSDVEWFLEVYADGGTTAANATIAVTYSDGSTGNLSTLAVGGAGPLSRAGNMFPLRALIPAPQAALNIRGITGVTLSAASGAAGSFGFTACRPRTLVPTLLANMASEYDWARNGLPSIPNDACLFLAVVPSTTPRRSPACTTRASGSC